MAFWMLQLRYHTVIWWGPALLGVGLLVGLFSVWGAWGEAWKWTAVIMGLVGLGRVVAQPGRIPEDNEATRLPMENETGGGGYE